MKIVSTKKIRGRDLFIFVASYDIIRVRGGGGGGDDDDDDDDT